MTNSNNTPIHLNNLIGKIIYVRSATDTNENHVTDFEGTVKKVFRKDVGNIKDVLFLQVDDVILNLNRSHHFIPNGQYVGSVQLSDGTMKDYALLPLTFQNFKTKGAMFVEFWQETGKGFLTGIGSGACPPVNSKFMFSKSITR